MNRRLTVYSMRLAVAAALALPALAPAAPPEPAAKPGPAATPATTPEPLTYSPPTWPEPPAVAPLLLRLTMATGIVLALGGAASWAVRRNAARQPAGKTDPRLRLLETLPLGNGTGLYLVECCGRRFVAGVSPSGFRSLAPLPEPFENELDVLTSLT
jgi:flagellar biogenesis protein FliO